MADKITSSLKLKHEDLKPIECLQYMADEFLELAGFWDEHGLDYFNKEFKYQKEKKTDIGKLELYKIKAMIIEDCLCQYVDDSFGMVSRMESLKPLILKEFEDSVIFPSLLVAIGAMDSVVKSADLIYQVYSGVLLSFPHYKSPVSKKTMEIIGKLHNCSVKSEPPLKSYEVVFEEVTEFLTEIEKGQFSTKLREPALAIKGYCKLKVGSKKYAETEAQRPINLIQFMQKHCEKQKIQLLRYRRKSLNDANFRKSITLPEPTMNWTSGQAKYYKADDLKEKWPSYCEMLPNLPSLKQ